MPEWRKIFEAEDSDLSLLWRLSHIVGRSKSDIRPSHLSRHLNYAEQMVGRIFYSTIH
jgi:hypothetical protein